MKRGHKIALFIGLGIIATAALAITLCMLFGLFVFVVVILLPAAADAIIPEPTPQWMYEKWVPWIQEEMALDFQDAELLRFEDTHEPPFGDGDCIVIVQVNDVEDMILQIERTGQWNQLPLNEQGEEALDTLLQWFPDTQISTEHGYWFFLDRYAEKYGEPSSYSRNFTFCVFDTDSGLFYYYEYDS